MRLLTHFCTISCSILFINTAKAEEPSIDRGLRVSIVAGCHDCHTEDYRQTEGKLDPSKTLKGSGIGWRGPWGTTYPTNLRLTADRLNEDGFVLYLSTVRSLPPMPWYRVRSLDENDLRSLYRYIKSLGPPGKQAPTAVGPDVEPITPFVLLEPPQSPSGCKRDLDCGVGQVCGPASQCVAR